ncbi:MAG: hypothetical protein DRO12_03875 [Thermoprotei archaeon]|nr:MAG: hypothetical protein DRO12_03875 [Thermoprotei archaeon]
MLLEIVSLTKVYSDGTVALKDITYSYNYLGKQLLFVGTNGAGKTTLLRILGGQLYPTSGRVHLLGIDVLDNFEKLRKRIAFLPQDIRPFLYALTPKMYIVSYLMIRGYSYIDANIIANRVLEEFDLKNFAEKSIYTLSGGLAKRTFIAMILAAEEADVYILDEPYTNLDPYSRILLWSKLRRLCRSGASVIMASHFLESFGEYVDEVVVLHRGRIVASGNPQSLLSDVVRGKRTKIVVKSADSALIGYVKRICRGCEVVQIEDAIIIYSDEHSDDVIYELGKRGYRVDVLPVNLSDIVVKLVTKGIGRNGDASS